MNIALIGYGAMGKLIRTLAEEKGHEVVVVIDHDDAVLSASDLPAKLAGTDAAIDHTVDGPARRHVEACVAAGIRLVDSTTGWNAERDELAKPLVTGGGTA